ncbi:glycosyltransferase [Streptomyces sp. NPDC002004]
MDRPHPPQAQVAVVVIGYNDAAHVADAVRSALAQGPVVREVIAVDDGSTDDSARVLERLASEDPTRRLKVVRRARNSGGCGTPRNDGVDAATAPCVMFLDSDDVLAVGAVEALLDALVAHDADVVSGLCLRRELPERRDVPWQPDLYTQPAFVEHPDRLPRLVHDTLCVNKLYRTAFLREHAIRFPDGRFRYEDFVFTARVLAAAPRLALIPDPVYVWQVRRDAAQPSISLDRGDGANWQARIEAHRLAVETLRDAGEKRLVRAARAKFVDHELRMYARELELRDPAYRREWWTATRAYLSAFDTADIDLAPAPGRVVARVVLASEQPRDLPRLKEVAARPSRLRPPHPRDRDAVPVWSADLPDVLLEHLLVRPMRLLPLAVDAELRPRRPGAALLSLRLHELYGRVAATGGPSTVDITFVDRHDGRAGLRRTASLRAEPGAGAAGGEPAQDTSADTGPDVHPAANAGKRRDVHPDTSTGTRRNGHPAADAGTHRAVHPDAATWVTDALVDLSALTAGTWDVRLRLHFADGTTRDTTPHATTAPDLLRRTAIPSRRHGVLLVHPYATHSGSLAVRVAPGLGGVVAVVRRRAGRAMGRLFH